MQFLSTNFLTDVSCPLMNNHKILLMLQLQFMILCSRMQSFEWDLCFLKVFFCMTNMLVVLGFERTETERAGLSRTPTGGFRCLHLAVCLTPHAKHRHGSRNRSRIVVSYLNNSDGVYTFLHSMHLFLLS